MRDNYYHILGLDNFASQEQIKKAFRQLAKKYHPDKHQGNPAYEEKFKQVSKAYNILNNAEQKANFDRLLLYQLNFPVVAYSYTPQERFYSSEPRKYTPKAWMFGKIFIIILVMLSVLIPISLLYVSSIRSYERGVEARIRGDSYEALSQFNKAIIAFGGRSAQAAISGSEISIYDLKNYDQALYFIKLGFNHMETKAEFAQLHYLKAMALYGVQNFNEALTHLNLAESISYHQDSTQLHLGLINAFNLNNFEDAEKSFDYLINNDVHPQTAWFGKGWCLQNMNHHQRAIESYSKVIDIEPNHAPSYYYRAINELILTDTAAACSDFQKSLTLGFTRGKSQYEYYCKNER